MRTFLVIVMLGVSLLCAGCFIPPSATLQTARVADRGEYRVTPYFSSVTQLDQEESDEVLEYGALLGVGTGDRLEVQARFDRFDGNEDGDAYNFTALGLKIGAVKDVLAIVLPVGMYWGNDIEASETLTVLPAIIGTVPVNRSIELFGTTKWTLALGDAPYNWFTAGLGASFGPDVREWALIPEVDWSWDMEDEVDITWFRFGVALAFFPGGGEAQEGTKP